MVVGFIHYACYMEIEPKKVNHKHGFSTPDMHVRCKVQERPTRAIVQLQGTPSIPDTTSSQI